MIFYLHFHNVEMSSWWLKQWSLWRTLGWHSFQHSLRQKNFCFTLGSHKAVNHLVRAYQPEARKILVWLGNFSTYKPDWAPNFLEQNLIFQTFFLNFVKVYLVYVWNTTSQYTLLCTGYFINLYRLLWVKKIIICFCQKSSVLARLVSFQLRAHWAHNILSLNYTLQIKANFFIEKIVEEHLPRVTGSKCVQSKSMMSWCNFAGNIAKVPATVSGNVSSKSYSRKGTKHPITFRIASPRAKHSKDEWKTQ